MERKQAIQEAAEASLRNMIGKNGGDEKGEIFAQLIYLTDKIETFGEDHLFIALPVKEALVRMLDADARYEYEVSPSKDGGALTVTCKLFWSENQDYAGLGTCTRYLSSIFRFDSLSEEERKEKWVKTCKSLARADAIRDALALSAFDFDESDKQIADEEKIKADKELDKALPEMPTKKSVNSSEKKEPKKETAEIKEEIPEPFVPEETHASEVKPEEPTQITIDETFPTLPTEEVKKESSISYEEALKTVADMGVYKGNALGDILNAKPKNSIWLLKNEAACKDACQVIIDNTPELAELVS